MYVVSGDSIAVIITIITTITTIMVFGIFLYITYHKCKSAL